MQSFESVREEVDKITDGLGKGIDDKIKKTVIALRMMEVNTDSSCEGHRSWGYPYPWVGVYAPKQDETEWIKANLAERKIVGPLIKEFNDLYSPNYPLILQDWGMYGAFKIQSFYWKQDHDIDPDNLEEYQKVMDAFADFVINKASTDS